MAFEKGKSGNPGGRTKDKAFAEAVRLAVSREAKDGRKKLFHLADALVGFALAGEGWAMQQIADRLDGKPAQESDVTLRTVIAKELGDDVLADIATGSSEGTDSSALDPSQLN